MAQLLTSLSGGDSAWSEVVGHSNVVAAKAVREAGRKACYIAVSHVKFMSGAEYLSSPVVIDAWLPFSAVDSSRRRFEGTPVRLPRHPR